MKAQISSIPDYTGTVNYPYWETFVNTPMSQVKAAAWCSQDTVINDWDWALPSFILAPKKSTFSMLRNSGLNDSKLKTLVKPDFQCKPTVAHWIKWADLEAVEGTYTFDKLIANIRLTASKGFGSIIRIHTAATIFAPTWVRNLGIDTITYTDGTIINYNVKDPKFHSRYLKLVKAIGECGIPHMPEVAGIYIGYASKSFGDEGIGPYHNTTTGNDTVQHVRERLEAWDSICNGVEDKVFMGGPSDYGQSLGFGLRRGFVENYLYTLPDNNVGQKINANGYIYVDESRPIIAQNLFQGEENEEYHADYATVTKDFQYGTSTEPFTYRYFSSNLRILQMRCNELLNYEYALMPKMLAWVGQELGRTLDEAPDIWAFLRESYIESGKRTPVKNFERWLFQRDATGYTTTPAIKIDHGFKMWMCADDRRYDYIAREGKKIGFNVDKSWPALNKNLAFKITVFDIYAGTLNLKYSDGTNIKTISKPLLGDNILRTYTIYVSDFKANSNIGSNFDFTLESESDSKNIVVSFVRVVAAFNSNYSLSTSAVNGAIQQSSSNLYFAPGSLVKLKAIPANGYKFSSWGGDLSGTVDSATIVMDGNKSISANFSQISSEIKVFHQGSWVQGTTIPKGLGSNRALVVMLYGESTGDILPSTVSYGGQTMTKVVEKSYLSGSYSYTGAYVLNEAGITAATSESIAVTWSSSPPSAGFDFTCSFFSNVNQSSLTGASASNGLAGTTLATSALTNTAGDMVLVAGTSAQNGTYTINNGFTRGIPETSASFGDITSAFKEAIGNNEIPSLTMSASMRQTIIGFVLKKDDTVIPQFTIKATAGSNGSINPIDSILVNSGDSQTFTITPNSGYEIDNVTVDEVSQGAITSYSFTNVTTNHTISATFKAKPYNVKVSVGLNGSIFTTGSVLAVSGANLIFNIVPNSGYEVDDVMVNGSSQGAITSYSYINATPNITINATFKPILLPPVAAYSNSFSEILSNSVSENNKSIEEMGKAEALNTTEILNVADKGIRIYPNPVSTILNIDFSSTELCKEIRIFNAVGQLIYSTITKKSNIQINVQSLKIKEFFLVQIIKSKEVSNYKIVMK